MFTKVTAIYGAVSVKGREYEDDAIAQLVGRDITGWKHAGDQSAEESLISVQVADGGDLIFSDLADALAFIAEQKEG